MTQLLACLKSRLETRQIDFGERDYRARDGDKCTGTREYEMAQREKRIEKLISELQRELTAVNRLIHAYETIVTNVGKRDPRGRKSLSDAERKAHSERMKAYWQQRKAPALPIPESSAINFNSEPPDLVRILASSAPPLRQPSIRTFWWNAWTASRPQQIPRHHRVQRGAFAEKKLRPICPEAQAQQTAYKPKEKNMTPRKTPLEDDELTDDSEILDDPEAVEDTDDEEIDQEGEDLEEDPEGEPDEDDGEGTVGVRELAYSTG
jgi:hypothetical protein